MIPLSEALVNKKINDYSSIIDRYDFSDAEYCFEFSLEKFNNDQDLINELTEDLRKLSLSVRKNTGGIKHIDNPKELEEIDAQGLQDIYGQYRVNLKVLSPMMMGNENRPQFSENYWILIPGRPVCESQTRYYSRIKTIVSKVGALKRNNDIAQAIVKNINIFGKEKIQNLLFYVFKSSYLDNPDPQEIKYWFVLTFEFKDNGDEIINNRNQRRHHRIAAEQEYIDRKNKLEQEEKDYQRRKEEYIRKHGGESGPGRYYAEKDWLRSYGDSRFESNISMRNSNYTGD